MSHPPNIPATPQTDERNFPRYDPQAAPGKSGYAYPRMLHREFLPEDRQVWQEVHKRIDDNAPPHRREYWLERCPRARAVRRDGTVIPGDPVPIEATQELIDQGYATVIGEPVIARDPAEEKVICEILGIETPSELEKQAKAARSVTVALAGSAAELEALQRQNTELAAAITRNTELKAAGKPDKSPSKADNMAKARAARKAKIAERKRSLDDLANLSGDIES